MTGEIAEIPAEGSLAPDTYLLSRGGDRNAVLAEMARRQEAILAAEWENRAEGLPYADPQEALIMASIVEKETAVAAEHAARFVDKVAGLRRHAAIVAQKAHIVPVGDEADVL